MKASDAIARLDAIKPNQYDESDKLAWLHGIDVSIYTGIISWHEHEEAMPEVPYTLNTELMVQEPFTSLYIRYLEMMVDYHNAEYDRYSNDMMMYNADFNEFAAHYNRTHMPLQPNHTQGAKV